MICKRIQEFILTDYSDGELTEDVRQLINAHINQCSECRQFERLAKDTALLPLHNTEKLLPPESVWRNIKQAVSPSRPSETKLSLLREKIDAFLMSLMRKPVLSLATTMAAIVITIGMIRLQFGSEG